MTDEILECYRLLELEPGAPLDAAKEAYRELIKVWHPDRFPDNPKLLQRSTEKAKALAGGTDLVVQLKENIVKPEVVVDIKVLEELRGLKLAGSS